MGSATLSRCVKPDMVSEVYAYFTASYIPSTREVQFTVSESGSGHSGPIFKQIQATESISSRLVHWTTCEHRAMPTSPEAAPPPPPVQIISVPSNFPVPSAMVCKGDLTSNWEFFKQQWQDYQVATALDQKSQAIHGDLSFSHGKNLSPDLS